MIKILPLQIYYGLNIESQQTITLKQTITLNQERVLCRLLKRSELPPPFLSKGLGLRAFTTFL